MAEVAVSALLAKAIVIADPSSPGVF
jgi:hypothetical protein